MHFIYPAFLWALAAISIPIIIHLFHFRRYKKIVFSDIRFLKQLQEQNKSKQKLSDWLILLCRILTIAALVLAFAQPFIPIGEQSTLTSGKSISLFIDNSESMNAIGSEGPLFEMAKSKARAIVNAYGANDRFQLLSNSLSGSEQRYLNKSDVISRIDALEPSTASANINDIVAKQKAGFAMQNNPYQHAYIISDFQATQFNFKTLEQDTFTRYTFIPVDNSAQQNLSIDSVYLASPFIKPNQPIALKVKLSNHGKEVAEGITVTLKLNNLQKALSNVTIGGNESVVTEMPVTVNDDGWQKGEISISDYPITYDDKLYFSFRTSTQYNTLLISNTENKYINAVYADDANYALTQTSFGNINYQTFNQYNLIILNEPTEISSGLQTELDKYLEQGGQLFIIPPSTNGTQLNTYLNAINLPSYLPLSKQVVKINELTQQSLLFKDVFKKLSANADFPSVQQHYPLQTQSNTKGQSIVTLNNGNSFLWQAPIKKGLVFLLATPLQPEFTALPQHSLFVPIMLNMAIGSAKQQVLYYTIGHSNHITLPDQYEPKVKLIDIKGNKQELTTELSLRNNKRTIYADAINTDGWFEVKEKNSAQLLSVAAFNTSRNESAMRFLTSDELMTGATAFTHKNLNANNAQVLGAQISQSLSGKKLWRWFVTAALLFMLTEMVLIRLKK